MRIRWLFVALVGVGCGGGGTVQAQQDAAPRSGLSRAGLVGENVAVLPLTFVVRDTAVPRAVLERDRAELLRQTDSAIGESLLEMAPEVNWILPAELRRVARRNAGVLQDPDRMGHAALRSSRLTSVPDPTRSQLRSLVAFVDGRRAFIPTALLLTGGPDGGVQATLDLVLVDARTGRVGFRTRATGHGETPEAAVTAIVRLLFPFQEPTPP